MKRYSLLFDPIQRIYSETNLIISFCSRFELSLFLKFFLRGYVHYSSKTELNHFFSFFRPNKSKISETNFQ